MKGLYALPPGVDFAAEVADGLIARLADQGPEALARVTLHANSGRTVAALRTAFEQRGPLLLPQIRLIANLGADLPGVPAPRLARRLELARLVEAAARNRAEGQNIAEMSASLSDLMAEMQLEGLGPDALDLIAADEHAAHWQRALAFLKIAAAFHLDGAPMDIEARQHDAARALADDWAAGRNLPKHPVIVVGSTGSHGATRALMTAVARLDNGAVILPGFDFDEPARLWSGPMPDDHPQARYQPLIAALGMPARWTDRGAPDPARGRVASLALRPAPVTDQWIKDGPSLPPLVDALSNVTLIEADDPGTEAEAIAVFIRHAVGEGRPVTLIAADRMLTRRVTAALDRWRLIPDDSAGRPLPLTAAGLFLRHIAALFGAALTTDILLIVLKHPLTATGVGPDYRRSHLRHTRDLELHLRRYGPAFPDAAALARWGEKGGDPARIAWAVWVGKMLDRMAPLANDRAPRPLSKRLADTRRLAEALATGPDGDVEVSELWANDAGEKARAVLDYLAIHAPLGPDMTPGDFVSLLVEQLQAQTVRADAAAHPLIRIRGPREARTEAVGLVILAGLNEGGWPQALTPDPWLSRQMRRQAGLTLPERQIGLSAHDFQIGLAASEVVLTRARRDAEAETIPSRWLNRMLNLIGGLPAQGGADALSAMRARGRMWLDLAVMLARPLAPAEGARRPAPIPPEGSLRELSVTGVGRLIRDPYAIYARNILRLFPLSPLRPAPDAAVRGTVLHEIIRDFLTPPPSPTDSVPVMVDRLMQATDRVLDDNVPWPAARGFWRARIAGLAVQLMTDERTRLQEGTPLVVESRHSLAVPGLGFTLTAQPDRIDVLHDGRAFIHDYKSGQVPTNKQIGMFDKQLPLEAAMMERGAFGEARPVAGFDYIQLGGEGKTHPRTCDDALIAETWDGFVTLVSSYVSGQRGFVARAAMEHESDESDYDHLSRFGEWSAADEPRPERVGDG